MAGKRSRSQGQLESEVLSALWDLEGSASSQELLDKLGHDIALTSLLTVLTRLTDKGLVVKVTGSGRSLTFKTVMTREQYAAEQLLKIVEGTDNPALAFAHFAKGLDAEALKALRDSLGR